MDTIVEDIEDINVKKRKGFVTSPLKMKKKRKLQLSMFSPPKVADNQIDSDGNEFKENNASIANLSSNVEESGSSTNDEFLQIFSKSRTCFKIPHKKNNELTEKENDSVVNSLNSGEDLEGSLCDSSVSGDLNNAFLGDPFVDECYLSENVSGISNLCEENTSLLVTNDKDVNKSFHKPNSSCVELDECLNVSFGEIDESCKQNIIFKEIIASPLSCSISKDTGGNVPVLNTERKGNDISINNESNVVSNHSVNPEPLIESLEVFHCSLTNQIDKTENINYFDGSLDDWDFSELVTPKPLNDLDLSSWQHCKVLTVTEDSGKGKILLLKSTRSDAASDCALRGVWNFSKVESDAIVSVKAYFQLSESMWIIDNDNGFLILYPDILISPTTIVGSVSCMRQGVLNFLINYLDTNETSKILVSGCLIHELFQEVLMQGNDSPEFIATVIEEIISSSYNVCQLYSSKMTTSEARSILLSAVPNITNFCKLYSIGCEKKSSFPVPSEPGSWKGEIKSVLAVEDNYWVPQLGLKGKVDVTVTALEQMHSKPQMMPVEVKTGSARNSVEHRGQVILYCLMASQITPEVDRGLLVYLKEGFARKVQVGRREQRDIIHLRNELVKFLNPQASSLPNSSMGNITLPDPTGSSQACNWCDHKTICASFLRQTGEDKKFMGTKAQDLRSLSVEHITSAHINYIVHWSNLLWTEERDKPDGSNRNLWISSPASREKNGLCFSNLELCLPVKCKDINSYFHTFQRENQGSFNFYHSFSVGQMILVSTNLRLALVFGFIVELNNRYVTVDLPRNLSQNCSLHGDRYIIDIYEVKSNISWSLGNLASLLFDTPTASKLRNLIIDCIKPVFDTGYESMELKSTSLFPLNESQLHAIKKAFAAEDYLLIRGYPGSGKSSTLAVLIQQMVARGLSVLLTAHTHSAVDTVLLKLVKYDVDFIRIGHGSRIHKDIHPWGEQHLTKHCHTPEQLESAFNKKQVVAVTCWGVKHALFSHRTFDVCIVDESTQVIQPLVLGPLLKAKKFILVGDPEQLPPVVRSKIASECGLSKCLFTRLDSSDATVQLDLQYRMNSKINELANSLTYRGELKCASQSVANATLLLSKVTEDSLPLWLRKSLSCDLDASIIFINIPKIQLDRNTCINRDEADVVKILVEAFLNHGVQDNAIGIMAPYRDQVKYLESEVLTSKNIETNTVDQYQGRDKDIIIFSCTNNWSRNDSSEASGILSDKRRMTVAITRAKFKLILVGNEQTLRKYTPFENIINFIDTSYKFEVIL